jgi:predicted dienelactone hydrolase
VSRLPLVEHLSSHVIHGSTLDLTFTLTAMARVQLLARRHNRLVASTRRVKLRAGRRRLELRLDPRRWPTKLDCHAVPLAPTPIAPGSQPSGGSQTAPAPRSENSFST